MGSGCNCGLDRVGRVCGEWTGLKRGDWALGMFGFYIVLNGLDLEIG